MWINPDTVILGAGLRTNDEGATQVSSLLHEMDVEVVQVVLPPEAIHLMGTLRIVDRDLAICWQTRFPSEAVEALREHGYMVFYIPDACMHEGLLKILGKYTDLHAPYKILGGKIKRSQKLSAHLASYLLRD